MTFDFIHVLRYISIYSTRAAKVIRQSSGAIYQLIILRHEGHIKQFGQFTFDKEFGEAVSEYNGFIIVNPKHLLSSLRTFLDNFLNSVGDDANIQAAFLNQLSEGFGDEIQQVADTTQIQP